MVHFDTLDGGRSINKFPSDTKKIKKMKIFFQNLKTCLNFYLHDREFHTKSFLFDIRWF